jgi:hypothetical protein
LNLHAEDWYNMPAFANGVIKHDNLIVSVKVKEKDKTVTVTGRGDL